jgi:branched-chain amino acid transport system permease protein
MLSEQDIDIEQMANKDLWYLDRFEGMQRKFLKTLVCDEVIEEHRLKPLGQHSEPLERLLIYFRRLSAVGKLAIKRESDSNTFRIIALSGVRGIPPKFISDDKYSSVEEAYHGLFLKHISTLAES